MKPRVTGIHHVTSICGPVQQTHDFHTQVLGQRLVKRTVNLDAPRAWHLYFGDRTGTPGSLATCFIWAEAGQGRIGPGMVSAMAYAVAPGSLDHWVARLSLDGVDVSGPMVRFGERVLRLRDPDGLPVELVETQGAAAMLPTRLHSATLWSRDAEATEWVLTDLLGLAPAAQEGERRRLACGGQWIDIATHDAEPIARSGTGTFHHLALCVPDEATQMALAERLSREEFAVTDRRDRQYFRSVYFHEPGGILIEIATAGPGVLSDESEEVLGRNLCLPEGLEAERAAIEAALPAISLPA